MLSYLCSTSGWAVYLNTLLYLFQFVGHTVGDAFCSRCSFSTTPVIVPLLGLRKNLGIMPDKKSATFAVVFKVYHLIALKNILYTKTKGDSTE